MRAYDDGRDVLGNIMDTATDYDYGEKQVLQLIQYFNSLGRPAKFEGAVQAVYASFEKARATEPLGRDSFLRWKNSTPMKLVGADASALMAKIQAASANTSATAPSSGKSDVYDPNAPGVFENLKSSISIPWWVWASVFAAGVAAVGYVALPVVVPLLARRKRSA